MELTLILLNSITFVLSFPLSSQLIKTKQNKTNQKPVDESFCNYRFRDSFIPAKFSKVEQGAYFNWPIFKAPIYISPYDVCLFCTMLIHVLLVPCDSQNAFCRAAAKSSICLPAHVPSQMCLPLLN